MTAPKPDPGARMVSWPTLIALRIRSFLSWPWQVRQMKAAGFRHVGWMTWETGPERPADEVTLKRFGLRPLPDLGGVTMAEFGEHLTRIGRTYPGFDWHAPRFWTPGAGSIGYAPSLVEHTAGPVTEDGRQTCQRCGIPIDGPPAYDLMVPESEEPVGRVGPGWPEGLTVAIDGKNRVMVVKRGFYPSCCPDDVMAGIQARMKHAATLKVPYCALHCAADVADTGLERLPRAVPEAYRVGWASWMAGVDLIIEGGWEPGRWELREGDTVIDSGRLEDLP